MDRFQILFIGGSGLLMLVQSIRGWRIGVLRQLVNLAALILAYGAAILSGRMIAPLLHPAGYPDLLVSVLVGAIFGGVAFFALKVVGTMLYARTYGQRMGRFRLGYRAGGSALGFIGALATVWLSVLAIRCLGTVAEAEVNLAKTPEARRDGMKASPMAVELAQFKQSLNSGPTGAVLNSADPLPGRVYQILTKIAAVLSSVDSMQRFVAFPETKTLSQNPRIVALQRDPQIAREVMRRDFIGLLGNPKIVAVVNDPGIEQSVRSFDLEKALDYALTGNGKSNN